MANNDRLNQWVLNTAKDLNLRVTKLDWIDRYYKGYSDIAVKIEIDSKIFEGRGSDIDSTTALMKGVTEAIERFVCRANKISSIGVAGHYDMDAAKENSLLEFIERSVMAAHFNKKNAMLLNSTDNVSIKTKDFGKVDLKMHQFRMNTPENYFGIFTLAEGTDTGFEIGGIMGASVARSLEEAIRKSSIECLRNVAALAEHSRASISFDQFIKIERPTSEDSQNLLFNKQYCQSLIQAFLKSNVGHSTPDLNLHNLIFEDLEYSSSVLANCPLKFIRCLDQNRNPAPNTEFVG
jgi:hypothetical protein